MKKIVRKIFNRLHFYYVAHVPKESVCGEPVSSNSEETPGSRSAETEESKEDSGKSHISKFSTPVSREVIMKKNLYKYLLPAIVAGFFFLSLFFVHTYAVVDGKTVRPLVTLKEVSPKQAVLRTGIKIGEKDEILEGRGSLPNLQIIKVIRAKPVEIDIDGKKLLISTTQRTVGEMLKSAGIKIGEKDVVTPSLNSKTYPYMKVNIETYRTETKVVKIPIPYKTVYERNRMLEHGKVIRFKSGRDGVLEKRFIVTFLGGKKISEKEVSEKVITPAVNEIYMVGEARFSGRYIKKMTVEATAYSPRVIETDGNPWRTATGMRSGFGIVAVDPKVIPLGSLLYVKGYGYAVAGDTGSLIKGNRIDVFFYSTQDAFRWGRRKVTVYILPGRWDFSRKLEY